MKDNTLIATWILLFTTNTTITNHFSQFLYVKNLKYCSNSWFIYSVCGWNTINNLISIPNILFNSFVNSTINCNSLLLIIFSGNPWNFHILFLNNPTKSSANVSSIIVTKCAIFNNPLYITNNIFFCYQWQLSDRVHY